jgi:septum formation protein
MAHQHNAVLPTALKTPAIQKLTNKRVILASASPRRKEILQTLVQASFTSSQSLDDT